ncbi:unnamed protein product [Trifolium pratense]|uniref:Uncharacterized protein n=1 Tax=Trifolium pratense TaxID=57577 RepID=A0ACB0LF27_TRIPR|nr:unnamed protein product [Trifolium pratense]
MGSAASLVFLREERRVCGARARAWRRDSRSNLREFVDPRFTGFVVFDVESSMKLRSDCDTGKGFILYIKSIV